MKGFNSLISAFRFCRAYDELRNYYKASRRGEKVSLKQQRASYLIKSDFRAYVVYKVKLLTQMLEERYTLSKIQHIKLSSDRTLHFGML